MCLLCLTCAPLILLRYWGFFYFTIVYLELLCFPKWWLVPDMRTETKRFFHFNNMFCDTLHETTKQRKPASLSSSHLVYFEYIAK